MLRDCGDRTKTFNVTALALLSIVSKGVPVAKHGNRSFKAKWKRRRFSNIGSELNMDRFDRCSDQNGIGSCSHKFTGMKNVASVRREIGVRTYSHIAP